MLDQSLQSELLEIVRTEIPLDGEPTIAPDTVIADIGFDSLDLVTVIDAVEQHIGVTLNIDALTPESRIADLLSLVEAALNEKS